MKKLISIITILGVLMMLFGCSNGKMLDMPKYDKKECHFGKGFQDYTDYCKYFYNDDAIKQFETHVKFKKVSDSDIEDLQRYFKDFEDYIKDTDVYYVDMSKRILYFIHSNT